jgi:hypothetical protein
MSQKSIRLLAAIVAGLVLLMLALQNGNQDSSSSRQTQLLPGLATRANDATDIRVRLPAADATVAIRRGADGWEVTSSNNYAADVAKLQPLIMALSRANILEEKTSNPDQYAKLGVDDPDDGGQGSKFEISAADFSYSVILGNTAQGDYRYARIPGEPTSYLIDRNPDFPQSARDWLMPAIIDISAERIRTVTITHSAGEQIVIERNSPEAADFTVRDIPDGRELSYDRVGDGIAAALSNLTLQDVRPHVTAPVATTAVFLTSDGLTITAEVITDDATSWVAFGIEATPAEDEPAADDSAVDEPPQPSAAQREADELTSRLSGWQYEIPAYKLNMLVKRWEDLLKASES